MKQLIAVVLAALFVLALAGCGKNTKPEPTEAEATESGEATMVGAYGDKESPVVTEELKKLVEKAAAELDGAEYVPVAYVASQLVAGTNHLVLCKVTPVVPNAVTRYALVTIYEDLQGNAQITDVSTSELAAPEPYDPENPVTGGVGEPTTPEVTAEAKTALEKATSTLAGATYQPVALLGVQVVAGFNYTLLCKATPTVPDAEPYYTIVTVYSDLDGGAEITQTVDFPHDDGTQGGGEEAMSSQAD